MLNDRKNFTLHKHGDDEINMTSNSKTPGAKRESSPSSLTPPNKREFYTADYIDKRLNEMNKRIDVLNSEVARLKIDLNNNTFILCRKLNETDNQLAILKTKKTTKR